jgi:hypothetical protein
MSQYDFGIIDPYVVDGVQLSSMLNNWRDALYSVQRGPTRPSFAVPGQIWIDDSAGTLLWQVKLFIAPGIGDVVLYTINTEDGTVQFNKDVIGDYLPSAGGTINGNLAVTGTLNVANPASFGNAINATYKIEVTGPSAAGSFVWYDPSRPVDEKTWDAYSGGGSWFLRAVNDAYNAAQSPFSISRSGYQTTTIAHSSPIHYWYHANGTLYGQWDTQGLHAPNNDISHEFFVGRYSAGYGKGVINTIGAYNLSMQANNTQALEIGTDGYCYTTTDTYNANNSRVPTQNWVLGTIGPLRCIAGALVNADGSNYLSRGLQSINHYQTGVYRLTFSQPFAASTSYIVQATPWGNNGMFTAIIMNQFAGSVDIALSVVQNNTAYAADGPFHVMIFTTTY